MKKLLVFGGTSEEHGIISALTDYPIAVTLCVASEYGAALLPQESSRLKVRTGRMDTEQIADMIRNEGFFAVVDTTHPYAVIVTQNIKKASSDTGIPYLRLMRECSNVDGTIAVRSIGEAAEILKTRSGNVLITTGSKELAAYTGIPDRRERLYPRVLPTVESIEACLSHGFQSTHIIAMHGPFSKELNIAMMKQFDIKLLVTKDGGRPGGFPEKLEAARELGVEILVIGRPDDEGLKLSEVIGKISEWLEGKR